MKKIIQYTIYPFIMVSASVLLMTGMAAGYNHLWVTFPIILFYGLGILLLERWMPYEKDWLHGRNDWNLDLTYYVVNYSIKLTAQVVFIWLTQSFTFFNWFPVEAPFWIQVLLALTIIDFFLFFVHWQSHRFNFLWRLHSIHHSSERLYFLNGEKRHALHQLLEGGPGILVCLLIGTPQPVVVTALALLAINMFMQHTNLDYRAGLLKRFFCVAELHRWHHRADFKEAQVNFGAWLTVWDHLLGTAYDNPKMQTQLGEIGIAEERNFPETYWKQLLYPFSKKIQEGAKTTTLCFVCLFFGVNALVQVSEVTLIGTWLL